MGAKTLLSVAQFEQLPEIEGISYELDQGELVEVPSANLNHNRIRVRLARDLMNYLVQPSVQGEVILGQSFSLGQDIVRKPDLALIGPKQRDLAIGDANILPFGPALAVEIASPSNTYAELLRKKDQYLAAGARTVWIFAPSREVHVYTTGEHARILSSDDMLEEPVLLPGFSVRVGDIFDI